jgi:lipopolysaccharide transport system permease protein
VVEGFRWALLGGEVFPSMAVGLSLVVSFLFLLSGLFYFRRLERTFADTV